MLYFDRIMNIQIIDSKEGLSLPARSSHHDISLTFLEICRDFNLYEYTHGCNGTFVEARVVIKGLRKFVPWTIELTSCFNTRAF
jgi:hypothetical protein